MSKKDRLREKFRRKPPPADFTFDELVTLLGSFGFVLHRKASSHTTFVCQKTGVKIKTPKPHPNNNLKIYQISQISEILIDMGHFK